MSHYKVMFIGGMDGAPVYLSTNAKGPFQRTYHPESGNEEYGKALFLFSDLDQARSFALNMDYPCLWEVEPLSDVHPLPGESDLIENVYTDHDDAVMAQPIWDSWYTSVQEGDMDRFWLSKAAHPDVHSADSGWSVVVCDSFRYVQELPIAYEWEDE